MSRLRNIQRIVESRLCLGCGACAFICPEHIRLVDFAKEGIRPIVDSAACNGCTECLQVCPAFETDHTAINKRPGLIPGLSQYCGPVLEIWEGFATDPEIRFSGASGGAITALSLYCMERESMHGTLHIASDFLDPTRNRTRMSRSRLELLHATGSRYSPASACDSLSEIESAPSPCIFVGQPSEVTALRKAALLRPALAANIGFVISFFCAGSPSRQGTLDLLKKMGAAAGAVSSLRYRGKGWPGSFAPILKDSSRVIAPISYKDSWDFLQSYRPFSTHLSPDGTGEDSDISCGDPWYQKISDGDAGQSMLIVRTEKGRSTIRSAMAANYLTLKPAEPWKLLESQKNLIAKRGAVGGRIAALRAIGFPTPRLRGFSLFANWKRLPLSGKVRSTIGTIRRVILKKYFLPLRLPSDHTV
jgi:coenzyme F420 hydrogenase subunit beta